MQNILMKRKDLFLALTCIIIGFAYRLIPGHPSNITPVAAMALIGGMYISRRTLAFVAPILALYLGDLVLNNTILRSFFPDHSGLVLWSDYMAFNILAMIATVIIGIVLSKSNALSKILGGGITSSVAFFVITNMGAWLTTIIYPKTLTGLLACFTAGIPFFQNTLLSNFLFITLFVTTIEIVRKYVTKGDLASV